MSDNAVSALLGSESAEAVYDGVYREEGATFTAADLKEGYLKMAVTAYKFKYKHSCDGIPLFDEELAVCISEDGLDEVLVRWSFVATKGKERAPLLTIDQVLEQNWEMLWDCVGEDLTEARITSFGYAYVPSDSHSGGRTRYNLSAVLRLTAGSDGNVSESKVLAISPQGADVRLLSTEPANR